MKKLLLATVATIALSASGVMAAEPSAHGGMKAGSEVKGQAAGKAETTGSGAAAKSDADVNTGTQMKPGSKPKAGADNKTNNRSKSETTGAGADSNKAAEPKADSNTIKNKSGADNKANNRSKSETTGAGAESNKAAEPKADSNTTKNKSGAAGSNAASDNKAGAAGQSGSTSATTGSNASGNVSLTTEQRTKIRTTVLQGSNAPRIERSQINFSLNVGTAVPRSIHVVAVPSTIVEIRPAWRGYMYFVVGDELVIVEPGTLKIVAVLAV